MNRPASLVLFIPAYFILLAADECGAGPSAVGDHCLAEVAIQVEQGGTSAPIPNVCRPGASTTEWDGAPFVKVMPPLSADSAPNSGVVVTAAADAPLADYTGSIEVTIVGSDCSGSPCHETVTLKIKVVAPGTISTVAVNIIPTVGGVRVTDGIVDYNAVAELKAVVINAPANYELAWEVMSLWAPETDMDNNVAGMTSETVTTSPINEKERLYRVSVLELGTHAVLASANLALVGRPAGVVVQGPVTAVPEYPGTDYSIQFQTTARSVYRASLFEVLGSERWTSADFESFLRDPIVQANATWSLVEDSDRLNCEFGMCTNAPGEAAIFTPTHDTMSRVGAFRLQVSAPSDGVAFAHTYVRHY